MTRCATIGSSRSSSSGTPHAYSSNSVSKHGMEEQEFWALAVAAAQSMPRDISHQCAVCAYSHESARIVSPFCSTACRAPFSCFEGSCSIRLLHWHFSQHPTLFDICVLLMLFFPWMNKSLQKRFVLEESGCSPRIRAAQGHSVQLEAPVLQPVADASSVRCAVHATSKEG